tara:strand:- start:1794 stop:1949 length:156 start_codon:yes stop_codon:yes gene_type:complete
MKKGSYKYGSKNHIAFIQWQIDMAECGGEPNLEKYIMEKKAFLKSLKDLKK